MDANAWRSPAQCRACAQLWLRRLSRVWWVSIAALSAPAALAAIAAVLATGAARKPLAASLPPESTSCASHSLFTRSASGLTRTHSP